MVKRKKVGGRRFGGRRINSEREEKEEVEKGNEKEMEKEEEKVEKEEEGRVVMTGLRRKVRRKIRRRDRVENSGRKAAEAPRKNSARQEASLKNLASSARVNTFSSKNLGEASLKNLASEPQVKTWSPKTSTTPASSPLLIFLSQAKPYSLFIFSTNTFPFSHPHLYINFVSSKI